MIVTFRPAQPGDFPDPPAWRSSPFRASYSDTLVLLDRELRHLGAGDVVFSIAVTEDEIRLDGQPRANARPSHPGVVISFESREHGPLRYRCNRFGNWRDNVRAIALGLEALRKVDRYGITSKGEQYTGWKALPAGGDEERAQRGRRLIEQHGSVRAAEKATHPDVGGNSDDFAAVQAAKAEAVAA